MKQAKSTLAAGLVAASSLATAAVTHAQAVYTETTDAGQMLTVASDTTALGATGTGLGMIDGTLSSSTDADLYKITISTPTTFFASTVNTLTASSGGAGGLDTELFLFDASGNAIAANDDAKGTTTQSSLANGNTLYANLGAGTYYIGISLSGNEPVNSNNQLLFATYPGGDTTATRGTAAGLNPTTESTFNGQTSFAQSGNYEIDFALPAPEPSTWATVALGGVAAAIAFMRRTWLRRSS